ncbi:MAG: MarR family transcriptional regulator [Acidimicrobiales bacterium]
MQKSLDEVTDALLGASRALVAIAARSLAEVGDEVTLPQYRTLVVLSSRGPQTLQGLADELEVAPSTATRMCDRLVAKGLLQRDTAPDSRREVRLSVTSAGDDVVDRVTRRRRADLQRIVGRLRNDQRAAVTAALHAFAEAAGEVPEQDWSRGWR